MNIFSLAHFPTLLSLPPLLTSSSGKQPFNLTLSSQAAVLHYSPARDGPIESGWNVTYSDSPDATYARQTLGRGANAHRTSVSGASVALDWVGTAVVVYGRAAAGEVGYTIAVDGNAAPGAGAGVPPDVGSGVLAGLVGWRMGRTIWS